MRSRRYPVFILLISMVAGYAGELFSPLPQTPPYHSGKAALGMRLFFDPTLSRDNTVSCSSCHDLNQGGDDGLPVSVGIEGKQGTFNAPTVLNSRYNFVQFWDGRAPTLQEQAKSPLTNPVEMDATEASVVKAVKSNPDYVKAFTTLYPEGITFDTIVDAIARFEEALVTPDSRFDRYLRGDDKALTPQELTGLELFQSKGCVACHHGVNLGGNLYQKLGIIVPVAESQRWDGRFAITGKEEDRYVMKVPSLRNVTETAPYLHDGSLETLDKVVRLMAEHQLGRSLSEREIQSLVAFLHTLKGETPPILQIGTP